MISYGDYYRCHCSNLQQQKNIYVINSIIKERKKEKSGIKITRALQQEKIEIEIVFSAIFFFFAKTASFRVEIGRSIKEVTTTRFSEKSRVGEGKATSISNFSTGRHCGPVSQQFFARRFAAAYFFRAETFGISF